MVKYSVSLHCERFRHVHKLSMDLTEEVLLTRHTLPNVYNYYWRAGDTLLASWLSQEMVAQTALRCLNSSFQCLHVHTPGPFTKHHWKYPISLVTLAERQGIPVGVPGRGVGPVAWVGEGEGLEAVLTAFAFGLLDWLGS